ncbi:MAG: hypothetical protein WCO62_11980, partial [Betaproteobacteria bacterium]
MSTMNIFLPDTLKAFVDEQVSQRGFGTSSEYVHELIRRDQEIRQLGCCWFQRHFVKVLNETGG